MKAHIVGNYKISNAMVGVITSVEDLSKAHKRDYALTVPGLTWRP